MASKTPVIVSACLLGLKTRYDGGDSYSKEVAERKDLAMIPVCPEQLGGLPTPRLSAEITIDSGPEVLDGTAQVIDSKFSDPTAKFINGANKVMKIVRITGAKKAILKEKSPSCGVTVIKRDGKEIEGVGVLTALLKREGIEVEGI